MKIPLDDLALQFREIEGEALDAAARVMRSGRYILTQGEEVTAFETEFARYCESRHAVGLSSGTAALHLAVKAAGIGAGDEVLVPANTYIATAFGVSYTGARPVFVDADPVTYTIDPVQAAASITSRTRAIMAVHLYGQPADMDALGRLADKHGLRVIEDAAQAHGARFGDRRVGTLGDAAAFSFYPGKNLGAVGDGGALTTNDDDLAAGARQLRYMGQRTKYVHEIVGYQDRLDELQAALLAVKLRRLDAWNAQRREQAAWYGELLAGTPLELPVERPGREHVYHLYIVRAPRRDALKAFLAERGIGTAIYYPIPVHLQGAYADLGYEPGAFPETERAVAETLALPVFPGYTRDTIEYVAESVTAFYAGAGAGSGGGADSRVATS
jgi:dTDP-4-amino-4,6-dideoxygalactose transaminase